MTKTETHLHVTDCLLGMKHLAEKSVDVVVTSPPYNLGIKYAKYNDNQRHSDYMKWTKEWIAGVHRVLKDGGSFFLNLGAAPSQPLLPYEVLIQACENGWVLQNTIHWVKSISVEMVDGKIISAGHFKPINSPRYLNDCHEFVFHLTKSGNVPIDRLALGVPYTDKSNLKRWVRANGNDKRCRGNNWQVPYQTIKSRDKQRPHPATFPSELAEKCIRLHGNIGPETVVLDPFVGIGSAAIGAIAAEAGNFIGFDIDESYLDEAKRRIA